MKLYHIHKPNKYDGLYEEGNIFVVGNSRNTFMDEFLDRTASYLHHSEEKDGKILDVRHNIDELLDLERIKNMTKEQQEEVFYIIKKYVINSEIDFRELILEEVRSRYFVNLPSRRKCIWLCDEQSLEKWIKYLEAKDDAKIFEVETKGNLFVSRDSLLPQLHYPRDVMYKMAYDYWNRSEESLKDADDKEYLFQGEVKLLRRVK